MKTNPFWLKFAQTLQSGEFYSTMKKKNKQASNAGVSRQCLEDKMSKGARNVEIGHFDITRPPERV